MGEVKELPTNPAPPVDVAQDDYFGFAETHRVQLPDGKSYIEHATLNEGARRKYLNATNRDVRIERGKGDAHINMAPGDERRSLLETAITGWNLVRDGKPVPFDKGNLQKFLDTANPKIIDIIEKDVRLKNPWLLNEMTVEDIDREIEALQEMRATVERESEGKDNL
jgi:hypothetical protein